MILKGFHAGSKPDKATFWFRKTKTTSGLPTAMRLPPLRSLQVFDAVARKGSVTGAAQELNVSPGAVTQQIRVLEDALGVPLIERRGKGVELTAWGRLYQGEIREGFRRFANAQDALNKARWQAGLVVSCLPSVATKWLSRQLFDWQASHPAAQIHLAVTEVEPRLGVDRADFRLCYGEAVKAHDHYVELFTDEVVPACSPDFLERHPVTSPAEILRLPLLGIAWEPSHGTLPSWDDWAAAIGTTSPAAIGQLTFSLSSSAIDAAADGRGFVLGQLSMIADDLASGRLVVPHDIRLPLPEPYFLAWDRAALNKPFAAGFRQWIVAVARRQASDHTSREASFKA